MLADVHVMCVRIEGSCMCGYPTPWINRLRCTTLCMYVCMYVYMYCYTSSSLKTLYEQDVDTKGKCAQCHQHTLTNSSLCVRMYVCVPHSNQSTELKPVSYTQELAHTVDASPRTRKRCDSDINSYPTYNQISDFMCDPNEEILLCSSEEQVIVSFHRARRSYSLWLMVPATALHAAEEAASVQNPNGARSGGGAGAVGNSVSSGSVGGDGNESDVSDVDKL
jgi:hypothetical protein